MSPGLISNITDDGQNVQFPNDSTLLEGRVVNQSGVDWSLVKLWINLCHDSHDPECYPQKLNVDNPFRVIDVNDLCLVQIDGEVEYAALSYVWGKREQLELKEGNYTQFHQSNAFADIKHRIPDTIKDAITACLKLDVKYLWVDALCIQQDSKDDKDRLIAIMDQVYAGAVLTLVAADGEDSWSGLHGVRPGTRIVQQTQERIQNLQFGTTAQDLNTILHQSKWSTRGWTFQEKVCSKRLLLFGKTQCLFWC
ncbi:HET-domain-containing protein, partial [Cadophora sp. DSE1049]